MRITSISGIFLMMFSLSVLLVTGCDNPNEKTEVLPPIQGSLLKNGPIAAITPEGAEELREMILNLSFVKMYRDLFRDVSGADFSKLEENFEVLGKFEVIPRSNNYEVIFPRLTRIYPPEGEGIKNIEIAHDMKLFVSPTGDPSAFNIKFEASEKPMIVTVNTDAGQSYEVLTMSYKSGKSFETLWHNDFQMFAQLTGSIQNFNIEAVIPEEFRSEFDDIDRFSMTIADIQYNDMLEPDDNNLWSGPLSVIMNNIHFELPQNVGGISILKANLDQDVQKLNPAAYKNFFLQNDAFIERLHDSNGEQELDEDFVFFLTAMRDVLSEGLESFNLSFTASEIASKLNATPKQPETVKNFNIQELTISSDLSGLKEDRASINFAYGLKGIDAGLYQFTEELGGESPQELVPQNVNFGAGFSNVPIASFFDKIITIVGSARGDEEKAEELLLNSQDEFLKMLVEADTKFHIDDTYIGNDIWLLLVNGSGKLNPTSTYKSQGEADVRFYGLDFLLQKLDERVKSPNTSPMAQSVIQQANMGLGMMQMFGQQKKDENGRDYRGYFLTLTPDGQMQMNGTDLMQMMGMAR